MAHAQKPDFVFRQGRHFSRLLTAEVCASAVVMLDTPWSEVVWRVLATHSIRQFPLHFPSRASPCAITFQLDSNSAVLKIPLPYLSYLTNSLTHYITNQPTNFLEQSLSGEGNSSSASLKLYCIEPKGSLPRSQEATTCPEPGVTCPCF